MVWSIALLVILIGADQALKYWTVTHLALGESAQLIPGVLQLTRLHNYGAAWSSFSGMRWLLSAVTAAILIAVLVLLLRGVVRHPAGRVAGALILAGGLGNLIDRVRLGYVVDMFHFVFWPSYPVFNLADICIVAGAVLGAVYYLFLWEKHDKEPGA